MRDPFIKNRDERIKRAKARSKPRNVPGMGVYLSPRSFRVCDAMRAEGREVSLFSCRSRDALKRDLPRIRRNNKILYIFAPEGTDDRWRVLIEKYQPDYCI